MRPGGFEHSPGAPIQYRNQHRKVTRTMRNLRLLLAGIFLPVVLVTTAAPATAVDPAYGSMSEFTLEGDGDGTSNAEVAFPHIKCNVSARHKVSEGIGGGAPIQEVVGSIWCKVSKKYVGDPDWDSNDQASWDLTFSGAEPGEQACTLVSTGVDKLENAYGFTTSGTTPAECVLTQVCLDGWWKQVRGLWDQTFVFENICEEIDLGPVPELVGGDTCQYGTPMRTAGTFQPWPPNTARYYYPWHLKVKDDTTSTNRYWRLDGYQPGYNPVSTAGYQNGDAWTAVNTNDSAAYAYPGWDGPRGTGNTPTYVSNPNQAGNPGNSSGSPPTSPEGFNVAANGISGEQIGNQGRNYTTHPIGVTVPSLCIFWFGNKVVDLPNTDIDEPWAPLDEDVPPPEDPDTPVDDPGGEPDDGCEFSITDPSTYVCGVVDMLVKIWNSLVSGFQNVVTAITGLADAIGGIAGAILDGLWDFLVPDPSSWDIDGLVDQLQTRPPFSLLEPLADEATAFAGSYTSAGSCGVLADFGDAEVTCSDIQNAPGLSVLYEVVRIGLVVLTGWGLFRIFSQLFEDQG